MPTSSRTWLPMSLRTASLMPLELHRAGVAVDQRDAVQEEAGGEGAEQEVLERRLLAEQPAPAGQPAEQVERQREHLERDEHGEQVAGRREQHHPADREHQQRVDLGVVEALGRGLPLRLGAGQGGGLAGERRDARPRAGARRTARRRRARRPGSGPTGRPSGRRRRCVPSAPTRPRAAPSACSSRSVRDPDGADQRGDEADAGERRPGRGSAARAAGTPRRGRRGRRRRRRRAAASSSAYSMVGLLELGMSVPAFLGRGLGFDRPGVRRGRRRSTPTWLSSAVDDRVGDVEQRRRVEAEQHQRDHQRRHRADLAHPEVAGCPRPPAASGRSSSAGTSTARRPRPARCR